MNDTTDNIIEIKTDQEFVTEVLDYSHDIPVLIDFWAPWCGPCASYTPILVSLAREYGADKLRLAKINVEEMPTIKSMFGIVSIPYLVIIGNEMQKAGMIGVRSKKDVKDWIDGFFDYWRPDNGQNH